jgi:hypothetical protein
VPKLAAVQLVAVRVLRPRPSSRIYYLLGKQSADSSMAPKRLPRLFLVRHGETEWSVVGGIPIIHCS